MPSNSWHLGCPVNSDVWTLTYDTGLWVAGEAVARVTLAEEAARRVDTDLVAVVTSQGALVHIWTLTETRNKHWQYFYVLTLQSKLIPN